MKLDANSNLASSDAVTSGVDFIMWETVGESMCCWWRVWRRGEVLMALRMVDWMEKALVVVVLLMVVVYNMVRRRFDNR